MAKSMQVLTFRWDAEFVELLRGVAGPRGMSAFVRESVQRALTGDARGPVTGGSGGSGKVVAPTGVVSGAGYSRPVLDLTAEHPSGHEFVAQKQSPFKCGRCGHPQGQHAKFE